MTNLEATPIALFRRFQPKFREITWEPRGIEPSPIFATSKFHMLPETKCGYSYRSSPYLDIRKNNLVCNFSYDPKSDRFPIDQAQYAFWEAIQSGPFAGRKFYADPDLSDVERALKASINMRSQDVGVIFSHDGDAIPGLNLRSDIAFHDWGFFIPDSPERQAIYAAIFLERARLQKQAKEQEPKKSPPTIEELELALSQKLEGITA